MSHHRKSHSQMTGAEYAAEVLLAIYRPNATPATFHAFEEAVKDYGDEVLRRATKVVLQEQPNVANPIPDLRKAAFRVKAEMDSLIRAEKARRDREAASKIEFDYGTPAPAAEGRASFAEMRKRLFAGEGDDAVGKS